MYKVTSETVFGTIIREFDKFEDAMEWVRISVSNRVECCIEII